MGYGQPIVAAVTGTILASVGYGLFPDVSGLDGDELLLVLAVLGPVIVAGLAIALYGLFTGVESAVAAGTDRALAVDEPE